MKRTKQIVILLMSAVLTTISYKEEVTPEPKLDQPIGPEQSRFICFLVKFAKQILMLRNSIFCNRPISIDLPKIKSDTMKKNSFLNFINLFIQIQSQTPVSEDMFCNAILDLKAGH